MTTDGQHPLSYFDRVFIINLPSRADRRRDMDRQLRRIGLSLDARPIEVFPAIRPADKGEFDSIGARGAFMSHLGVMRIAVREGCRRILILEDDVNFIESFNTHLAREVDRLSGQDWHLFYGGYTLLGPEAPLDRSAGVDPARGIMLAHFLGLQSPAMEKGVQFLEQLLTRRAGDPSGGPMHVDGAYSWLRRLNPQLTTRLAVPELGYQRASRTDIHALRWFDRTAGVRQLAGVARSLKNLIHRK